MSQLTKRLCYRVVIKWTTAPEMVPYGEFEVVFEQK